VKDTAKSSFLICDLDDSDPRQGHPGAIKIAPRLSAAALIYAARSSSHRKLAEAIQLGEWSQSVRSAEGLSRASKIIADLSLGRSANSIGRYYHALSLNRQGPQASAEANEILIDVADHGPDLFRAKARVAFATKLRNAGDTKAALKIHWEALRIVGSCEHGKLHPLFFAALQLALIKFDEGDFSGASAGFQGLEPLARQVGLEFPALLHIYYNNVAFSLIANGRAEETLRLRQILSASPFRDAYPEWQRTCVDIAHKTRPRRPSFVSISVAESFTGGLETSTVPPRPEASSCAEIILFLLVFKVIRRQLQRVSVRLFSGLPLGRLLLAAREAALSWCRARSQLGLCRWSYLRVHPAYPRPPTSS
jgi:hypothetical protein